MPRNSVIVWGYLLCWSFSFVSSRDCCIFLDLFKGSFWGVRLLSVCVVWALWSFFACIFSCRWFLGISTVFSFTVIVFFLVVILVGADLFFLIKSLFFWCSFLWTTTNNFSAWDMPWHGSRYYALAGLIFELRLLLIRTFFVEISNSGCDDFLISAYQFAHDRSCY